MRSLLEINPSELEKYIEYGAKARRSICIKDVTNVSRILFDRLKEGGKLISFCNGDSAAKAQHFAAELSEIFKRKESLCGHRTPHKHLFIDGDRKRLRLHKSLLKTDRGNMYQE